VWRFIVNRSLWAAFLCFVVTVLVFLIFFTIPADPARMILPEQNPSPQRIAEARAKLGVDRPLYVQYGKFIGRLARGDLGSSYQSRPGYEVSVNELLKGAAPVTASVLLGAMALWLLVALPLGVWSALRPRGFVDRFGTVFVLLGISAPPFVVALLLRQFFAFEWQLLPFGGYCPLRAPAGAECGGVVDWAEHLILPWSAFALIYAAIYTRMLRANVAETLHHDFVRTARAKGAGELRVLRSHVLRNSLLAIVTMLGMDFAVAIGNAIYVEPVFGLPGLGGVAVGALRSGTGYDLPTILGITLTVSFAVIVLNLLVDVLYSFLDPRIRVG
jgi:peptide/nickel transport system permease protein